MGNDTEENKNTKKTSSNKDGSFFGKISKKQDLQKTFYWEFVNISIIFIISIWIWTKIVVKYDLWDINNTLFTFTFLITVIGLSFIVRIFMYRYLGRFKKAKTKTKKDDVLSKKQQISMWISGLIVSLILFLVASVPVYQHKTVLMIFTEWLQSKEKYTFISIIGDNVLSSEDRQTKIAGVLLLQTIHSNECLDELFRILKNDQHNLFSIRIKRKHDNGSGDSDSDESDYEYTSYAETLSYALASYELKARDRLLDYFKTCDNEVKETSKMGESSYERIFSETINMIEQINIELEDESLEPSEARELKIQLDEFEKEMKILINDLEKIKSTIEYGEPTLDVILDSFLDMDKLKNDPEIYYLARKIADDKSYKDSTRVRAFDLIAKLGSEKDFKVLLKYLENENEYIKRNVLYAIRDLHEKLEDD